MSLSNRINMRGGGGADAFPWNAFLQNWDRKTLSISSGGQSGYLTCLTSSPNIKSGCKLMATIVTTDADCRANFDVFVNGAWVSGIVQKSGTTLSFNVDLSAYVGASIQIRFYCFNAYNRASTFTLQNCYIE